MKAWIIAGLSLIIVTEARAEVELSRLIDSMAVVESAGNPRAVSPKGARGLLQIMPATWRAMTDESYAKAFDPTVNRRVAAKYLSWLTDQIRKDRGRATTDEVLAAYNGGLGRLQKADYRIHRMPAETRRYVAKVQAVLAGD